jgi:hypothetical protein
VKIAAARVWHKASDALSPVYSPPS